MPHQPHTLPRATGVLGHKATRKHRGQAHTLISVPQLDFRLQNLSLANCKRMMAAGIDEWYAQVTPVMPEPEQENMLPCARKYYGKTYTGSNGNSPSLHAGRHMPMLIHIMWLGALNYQGCEGMVLLKAQNCSLTRLARSSSCRRDRATELSPDWRTHSSCG